MHALLKPAHADATILRHHVITTSLIATPTAACGNNTAPFCFSSAEISLAMLFAETGSGQTRLTEGTTFVRNRARRFRTRGDHGGRPGLTPPRALLLRSCYASQERENMHVNESVSDQDCCPRPALVKSSCALARTQRAVFLSQFPEGKLSNSPLCSIHLLPLPPQTMMTFYRLRPAWICCARGSDHHHRHRHDRHHHDRRHGRRRRLRTQGVHSRPSYPCVNQKANQRAFCSVSYVRH